jgi:hypothetical protein
MRHGYGFWAVLVTFLMFAFFVTLDLWLKNYAPDFMVADVVGQSLGHLFPILAISIFIAVISKVAKKQFLPVYVKSMLIVGIPFCLFFWGGQQIDYLEKKKAALATVTRLQNTLNQAGKNIMPPPTAGPVDARQDPDIKAMAEVERFYNQFASKIMLKQARFAAELESIGVKDLLAGARIEKDKNFKESSLICKKARVALEKYQSEMMVEITSAKQEISQLDVSPRLKEIIATAYQEGMPKAIKSLERRMTLEKEALDEYEKIIKLFAKSQSAYVIKGNAVYFKKDADLAEFNGCLGKIREKADEQIRIQNRMAEEANTNFEEMKKRLQ